MEEVIRKIKVYKFDELSKVVQESIINKVVSILVDTTNFEELNKNSNLYKAYKKANEMMTPWFIGQYIWDYDKKNILKMCKSYNYLNNGEIYEEEE